MGSPTQLRLANLKQPWSIGSGRPVKVNELKINLIFIIFIICNNDESTWTELDCLCDSLIDSCCLDWLGLPRTTWISALGWAQRVTDLQCALGWRPPVYYYVLLRIFTSLLRHYYIIIYYYVLLSIITSLLHHYYDVNNWKKWPRICYN